MADLDPQAYRRRVHALVDAEIAELETMRARVSAVGQPPTDVMAKVCRFSRERVELLRERIRTLDHDPEVRRG